MNVVGTNAVAERSDKTIRLRTGRLLWGILFTCVFSLAAVLRVFNFNARNLWTDEGYTLLYSRLPWPDVLGINGHYDTHPPLYYALVKLTDLIAPEQVAARLVSVVAGVLTVLVLYELTRRLLNVWAAIVAAFVLTISPVHISYSQEGRQYAITLLTVTLSYLALVVYRQSPSLRWAIIYGVTTALSVYLEYCAIFALIPQIALFILIAKEQRRASIPIFGALTLAILSYLPWIPQAVESIRNIEQYEGTSREVFLGVTPQRFVSALRVLIGMGGQADVAQGQAMAVAAVALLVVAPFVAWKSSKFALLVALLLGCGTITMTVLAGFVSPSFAPRTMLAAVLGWAIVLGLVITNTYIPAWLAQWSWWTRTGWAPAALLGWAVLTLIIVVSAVSLYIANEPSSIQSSPQWPALADDVSRIATDHKDVTIIVPSKVDYVLIDVYAPNVLEGRAITSLADLNGLPAKSKDVWLAYQYSPAFDPYMAELGKLGYARVEQRTYPSGGILLERYHLP